MIFTLNYLRSILTYDPETGIFTNRVQRGLRGDIGKPTGSYDKDGYVILQINGKKHKAHRVAWLWMTGEWPEHEIDHKDGQPWNNVWLNLREATRSDNVSNSNRPIGESGFRGVKFDRSTQTWRARIGYGYRRTWLGPYSTAEEAYAAYLIAADIAHGEFALRNRNQISGDH